jgi:hypothetical protein
VSLRAVDLQEPCKDSSGSTDTSTAAAAGDLLSLSHLTALSSLNWRCLGEVSDVTLPQHPIKLELAGGLNFVGPYDLPHVEIRGRCPQDVGMSVLLQLPAAASNTVSLKLDVGYIERVPTPVACMCRPHRTRGQCGQNPKAYVHKGGVRILSYLYRVDVTGHT